MKSYGRILALTALLGANQLTAAPSLAMGDNAEIFLTAAVGVTIDDNIYLRNGANRVDDMILTFSPGVDMVFGRNSMTTGNLYYRHDILRYSDNSSQDTDLANVGLNTLYSNGKTKVDFGASFIETAQNEPSVAGLIVQRDTTRARAMMEVGATEKSTVSFGVRYDDHDYVQAALRDSETWTVPLDVYFEYSPKMQISMGYRYRSTDVRGVGTVDNKDHFFNIGARGEFTPKLSGQVRVGYSNRDVEGAGSDGSFGMDASLNYAHSAKTSVYIGLSNDYGTSALGDSTEEMSANIGLNSRFDDQWSWNVQLGYRSSEYPTREDDYFQGGVGLSYRHNEYLSFSASYTYRNNASDSAVLPSALLPKFSNNVFGLTANFRY